MKTIKELKKIFQTHNIDLDLEEDYLHTSWVILQREINKLLKEK